MNTTTADYLHAGDSTIRVVVYPKDGGYCAEVPAIPAIFAKGNTKEEAFENIESELRAGIRACKDRGHAIPWHPEGEESMIRTVTIKQEDMPCPSWIFTTQRDSLQNVQWFGDVQYKEKPTSTGMHPLEKCLVFLAVGACVWAWAALYFYS